MLTKAVIGVGGMGQGHLKSINPQAKTARRLRRG